MVPHLLLQQMKSDYSPSKASSQVIDRSIQHFIQYSTRHHLTFTHSHENRNSTVYLNYICYFHISTRLECRTKLRTQENEQNHQLYRFQKPKRRRKETRSLINLVTNDSTKYV